MDSASESLLAVNLAIEAIKDDDKDGALESLAVAKKSLHKRIKLVRLADKSPNGWNFVKEYVADDLASDSEDEKRIKRAESEASKKRKSFSQESAKKRFRAYSPEPSTSGRRQFFRSGGWGNRRSFRYEDRCFACGDRGHWRLHCTSQKGAKPLPAPALETSTTPRS